MLIDYALNQTGIVLRVKLRNSTSPSGAGRSREEGHAVSRGGAGIPVATRAANNKFFGSLPSRSATS